MKCQNCGKNEATVKYKEIINGKKQELYLCSTCAKEIGIIEIPIIISPIFSTIGDEYLEKKKVKQCSNCGYTLEEYSKTGVFGCPECYNTFESELDELFLKFHGKNRHIKIDTKKEKIKVDLSKVKKKSVSKIDELREKLSQHIKNEEYEEAAVLRDKIKKLEGK